MNKIVYFCGNAFIRVSKKKYDNFTRFFKNSLEFNAFMGWNDAYDWSLDSKRFKKNSFQRANECMVARHFFEAPRGEYYISAAYIGIKQYNLNTVVPKEREKRLSKKQKKLANAICKAFDTAFAEEAKKDAKRYDKIER